VRAGREGRRINVDHEGAAIMRGLALAMSVAFAGCLLALLFSPLVLGASRALNLVDAINDEAKTANVVVIPVRGGISVLMGSGANVTVLNTAHEKFLVDAGISYSKANMIRALNSISSAPPRYLVNTDFHWDHTDGDEWVHLMGAAIIAQENALTRLSVETRVEDWDFTFPAVPYDARPTFLVRDDKSMHFHGTTIEFKYYGSAHTDTDIRVYFVEPDVLVTGDTFCNGCYPFIDNHNGGSIDGMIRAAETNVAKASDHTVVIPGHGSIGGRAELIEFRDMLIAIRGKVAGLKTGGMSRAQVIAATPTEGFDAKWGGSVIDGPFFTRLVFDGLK
jgi:glyoxylase-like metal-dependent hydrolase (beta-lactamase superfamily II)